MHVIVKKQGRPSISHAIDYLGLIGGRREQGLGGAWSGSGSGKGVWGGQRGTQEHKVRLVLY